MNREIKIPISMIKFSELEKSNINAQLKALSCPKNHWLIIFILPEIFPTNNSNCVTFCTFPIRGKVKKTLSFGLAFHFHFLSDKSISHSHSSRQQRLRTQESLPTYRPNTHQPARIQLTQFHVPFFPFLLPSLLLTHEPKCATKPVRDHYAAALTPSTSCFPFSRTR